MLKYQSILEKLTIQQKVSLLTDLSAFSEPAINRAGVPEVRMGDLVELAAKRGVSFGSLANSWDVALAEEFTEDIAVEARGNGYKLLTTPDIKPMLNVYGGGLSEDPFLTGAYGGAMLRGIRNGGSAAALADFSLSAEDVEYLDISSDPRAINDLVKKPFFYATETSVCDGVRASLTEIKDGYRSADPSLFGEAVDGCLGKETFVFSKPTVGLPDFHAFLKGRICVEGGGVALERALGRYAQLSSDRDEGSVTSLETQTAIDAGLAISRETLDEAADRVIGFAFRANQIIPHARSARQDLGLRIAQESIVLLKNEGLLPLAKKTKILVVGDDFGFAEACSAFEVVGSVDGNAPGAAHAQAIGETIRAAKDAKAVVVFLRTDKRLRLQLSPDALALVDALSGTRKPLIAVVLGDFPVDFSFDAPFSAVLSAPMGSAVCAAAIESVLEGTFSPCGRLAYSVPDGADAYYSVLKEDKDHGRTKVGPFVGYRYYDTAGQRLRYPFGYGLSYTTFRYSKLELGKDEVSFTIQNTGKREGVEIAQLYIGFPKSGAIHPKKELKGFVRVALQAGESRRVTIPLPEDRFASFDGSTLSESVAKGVYLIYVGSSVQDVRLMKTLVLEGEERAEPKERAEEYFRDLSNIGENYRTDFPAKNSDEKFSLPRKVKWFHSGALGLLLLTLLMATVGGPLYLRSEAPSVGGMIFLLVDLGVAALAAIGLIGAYRYRKKRLQTEIAEQKLNFPSASTATTPESVFEAEFAKKTVQEEAGGKADEPHYFDKTFTFQVMAQELQTYLRERGMLITEKEICSFISAMASSHCMIVQTEDRRGFNRFLEIFCEYLGTDLCAGNLKTSQGEVAVYEQFAQFNAVNSIYEDAVRGAESDKNHIHICLFRHFGEGLFTDFTEGTQARKQLSKNLFLIFETEKMPRALPWNIVKNAVVIPLATRETLPSAKKTAVRSMGSYQFENLCRTVRDEFPLDERLWKRVDRLEEACSATGTYRLPNRLWIKLEKLISTEIACGREPAEALDLAIAAVLLPAIETDLRRERTDEQLIALFEEIFGEEQIDDCRAYINRTEKKQEEDKKKNG